MSGDIGETSRCRCEPSVGRRMHGQHGRCYLQIVVTGAAGTIGRALVGRFADRGLNVVMIDRFVDGLDDSG
jgi:hypothetical protein